MKVIELEKGSKEVVLPPGLYVIGDPCYNVPDEQWDRVLEESDCFDGQCHATFATFDGRTGIVVAFGTMYGDGSYKDHQGREYGVDAGLIGIIPVEDIDPAELDDRTSHVIKFGTPVVCYERDGVLTFGQIEINTDDDDDVEDDYFDEWNDNDE